MEVFFLWQVNQGALYKLARWGHMGRDKCPPPHHAALLDAMQGLWGGAPQEAASVPARELPRANLRKTALATSRVPVQPSSGWQSPPCPPELWDCSSTQNLPGQAKGS